MTIVKHYFRINHYSPGINILNIVTNYKEFPHDDRDNFLVHRDQFWTSFHKWGLDPLPIHYISPFTKVTDRIVSKILASNGSFVSEDHARVR